MRWKCRYASSLAPPSTPCHPTKVPPVTSSRWVAVTRWSPAADPLLIDTAATRSQLCQADLLLIDGATRSEPDFQLTKLQTSANWFACHIRSTFAGTKVLLIPIWNRSQLCVNLKFIDDSSCCSALYSYIAFIHCCIFPIVSSSTNFVASTNKSPHWSLSKTQ